ncbi:MAG: F0F1 ATP synthase subunit A [Bacteroidales bacterium]
MRKKLYIVILILGVIFLLQQNNIFASSLEVVDSTAISEATDITVKETPKEKLNVSEIIFGHIGDSYSWHIITIGKKSLYINLPIILKSKERGWFSFNYSKIKENQGHYKGFYRGDDSSKYSGKIVELNSKGEEVRPFDMSITKYVLAIFINSCLLLLIILSMAHWYKDRKENSPAPKGFRGAMEALVMAIENDVVKAGVGANYKKFSPYLLTVFFFILLSNIMSLIPIFPAGVDVTGNIAITMVLALFTMVIVNVFGTKHYWKDILWPDVPLWLKCPIPIMPFLELLGIFTKPFALMIRLFANMFSGHMAMLALTCLIFITASMGPVMSGSFAVLSVLFNIFMNLLELLVAFIQAYVFTMLSAVFIGLAQEGSTVKNLIIKK